MVTLFNGSSTTKPHTTVPHSDKTPQRQNSTTNYGEPPFMVGEFSLSLDVRIQYGLSDHRTILNSNIELYMVCRTARQTHSGCCGLPRSKGWNILRTAAAGTWTERSPSFLKFFKFTNLNKLSFSWHFLKVLIDITVSLNVLSACIEHMAL